MNQVTTAKRNGGRVLLTAFLAVALSAVGYPPARAETTCTVSGTTMTINSDHPVAVARTTGGAITVNGSPCSGATVSTVDKVNVDAPRLRLILSEQGFPGATDETGDSDPTPQVRSEIEFVAASFTTDVEITGTEGDDLLQASASGINYNGDADWDDISVSSGETEASFDGAGGDDALTASGNSSGPWPSRISLDGGPGDDTLTGGAHRDLLVGGPGADMMSGGAHFDWVSYERHASPVVVTLDDNANDGAPVVRGQIGGEADNVKTDIEGVAGSEGADTLTGNASGNFLVGWGGDDLLNGLGGSDFLRGLDDKDALNGGDGDDDMVGDRGADNLDGGAGDDLLVGGRGSDAFAGGDGLDYVDYVYEVDGDDGFGVIATIGGARSGLDKNDDGKPDENDRINDDVEGLRGTDNDDVLRGNIDDNVLEGYAGNDLLIGHAGDDELFGLLRDTGGGKGEHNVFDGGPGSDLFIGADGRDTVTYAGRNKAIVASLTDQDPSASYVPVYDDGADKNGDGVADEGDDIGGGIENVVGGDGADILLGNFARNRLEGGAGKDHLNGAGGNDSLFGDGGNDRFRAKDGKKDRLYGGAGSDRIITKDAIDRVWSIP